MTDSEGKLKQLAENEISHDLIQIEPLRAHASARQIYRLHFNHQPSMVGVCNDMLAENLAFVSFAKSFKGLGLRVPEIVANNQTDTYIETDLGDRTLMDELMEFRSENSIDSKVIHWYKQALENLIDFQLKGLQALDLSLCYQGAKFDAQAIKKDIHYFFSEYLGRIGLYSEADDFSADIQELASFGDRYASGYFMFRDFQSRNIMIHEKNLWYIDFQSGREGPLQYDLASLLFQSQANLPFSVREELFEHYLAALAEKIVVDEKLFRADFLICVLIRALQNLGAYGKLGLGQGKEYFLKSIPFALNNCRYLLKNWPQSLHCNNLRARIEKACEYGQG
jgi:aminoglycoside/choline kinase family phosphotransferase